MKLNSSKLLFVAAVAALGITLGTTSCSKELLNIDVPMEFANITFEIPMTPDSVDYADTTTVSANLDSVLTANKVKKENIKSIKLENISATCEGDSANNFNLLQSLKGEIATASGSFTSVGELNNNPDNVAFTVNVPANTGTDFRPYLESSTFRLRVSGKTRRAVTAPMKVSVTLKFKMEAGL